MKTILIKIGLITILAFLTLGCAPKVVDMLPKEYTGDKVDTLPLGTLLGCSRKEVEYGFTEEGCGDMWGANIKIDWSAE